MIKPKHFTLVLFIGLIWGKPIEINKKVDKYSFEYDYFICDDSLNSVIKVSDLISIVKDSSVLSRVGLDKKVHLIIDKYSKQKKEYLITKKDMNRELIQKMAQVV